MWGGGTGGKLSTAVASGIPLTQSTDVICYYCPEQKELKLLRALMVGFGSVIYWEASGANTADCSKDDDGVWVRVRVTV